jgi:hypothetical protein
MIAKYRKVCNGTIDSRVVTNKKPFERGLFYLLPIAPKESLMTLEPPFI